MTLRDAIDRLPKWPHEATIFAERIDGEFRPESQATVIELTEDEFQRPINEVAAERAPGQHYFLEVFVAADVLDDWRSYRRSEAATLEQELQVVIYYAKNDAYPRT